jgi:Uma2 family endonuclease
MSFAEERIMPVPASARQPMTADEFIAWAMEQPEGERYELERGRIVGMAPERLAHARVKYRALRALDDAIRAAGLPCEALPDGVSVEIDATTVYEPDALVRCGPELPPDTIRIKDPLILVEVLSPST